MNAQQLRYAVQQWLNIERVGLLVILESFGFKYGAPNNADFMFDMRSLPNPYYDPELRPFTGHGQTYSRLFGPAAVGSRNGLMIIDHFISRWLAAPATREPKLCNDCHRLYRRATPLRLCCGKTGRAPQRPLRTPCPPPSGTKLGRTLTCRFRRPQRKKP